MAPLASTYNAFEHGAYVGSILAKDCHLQVLLLYMAPTWSPYLSVLSLQE